MRRRPEDHHPEHAAAEGLRRGDCEVREPDPQSGEFLQARINRVKELLLSIENSFWPNQYSNIYNSLAHHQTMHEIYTELGGRLDYLFCATSTCGTIRGCWEYLRMRRAETKVIAVDAKGSVIFGGAKAKRLIPGHGAAVCPALFLPDMVDECVHVSDEDCVVGCWRLVRQEGILAGGSLNTCPGIKRFTLYDVDPARAEQFKERCSQTFNGIEVDVAQDVETALGRAPLISLATTAVTPHISDLSACVPDATVLHISLRDLTPEAILSCDNVVDDIDHVCARKLPSTWPSSRAACATSSGARWPTC